MAPGKIIFVLIACLVAAAASGEQVIKLASLSSTFTNVPGTPRVVHNSTQNIWLAVWRQDGSPASLKARVIQANGLIRATKTIVTSPSASVHSFDAAFDSVNNNYLFVYESPQGLSTQLVTANLLRQGQPHVIEAGAVQTVPRLVFDSATSQFTLFWLSSQNGIAGKAFKSRVLDATGAPIQAERIVKSAARAYEFLSVEANEHQNSVMALLLEGDNTSASLVGVLLRPNGTLLQSGVKTFQAVTAGLRAFADLAFSSTGVGMAFWTDRDILKRRKILPAGGFGSPTHQIPGSADQFSNQPAIVYDSTRYLFVAAWSFGNTVRTQAFDPTTAAGIDTPFIVANSTLSFAGNLGLSHDASTGNRIVVWDDFSTGSVNTFRVRAAIIRN